MKKTILSVVIIFFPLLLNAQVEGDFYKKETSNGYYYYFKGTNTSSKTISITIWAINDPLDQVKEWRITLGPDDVFVIGPKQGWVWQHKERLEIQFANGSIKRWKHYDI